MKTYKTQQRYPSPKTDIAAATSPQCKISRLRYLTRKGYRTRDIACMISSKDRMTRLCTVIPRDIMLISTTSYTPPI